jgi:uncharacterized protein YqgQ
MTQVTDDVAELNAGTITTKQLGVRWAARTWLPIHPEVTDAVKVAALEVDDAFGPSGSWWEVEELLAKGVISRADYSAVNKVIEKEKSKAKMRRAVFGKPTVGHRHPNEIELSATTDFELLQKTWQGELLELLKGWEAIKGQQIVDLKDQIQVSVDSGSVSQVAGVMTQTTGEELILKHMISVMENSVVAAKGEAERQGIKLSTIDTTNATLSLQRQASAMGQIMARSISNTAATQALTRYGVDNLSGTDVANAVGEHLAELSPAYAEDMLGGALNQAQNEGRTTVFEQAPADIYSSELLDKNTCGNCEAIDGTAYDSLADAQSDYPTGGYSECLGGPRCRGTLVAVYAEATTPDDS